MTNERLEGIRELNAGKKWGHPDSAVQCCAELLEEVDRLRADLETAERLKSEARGERDELLREMAAREEG